MEPLEQNKAMKILYREHIPTPKYGMQYIEHLSHSDALPPMLSFRQLEYMKEHNCPEAKKTLELLSKQKNEFEISLYEVFKTQETAFVPVLSEKVNVFKPNQICIYIDRHNPILIDAHTKFLDDDGSYIKELSGSTYTIIITGIFEKVCRPEDLPFISPYDNISVYT